MKGGITIRVFQLGEDVYVLFHARGPLALRSFAI